MPAGKRDKAKDGGAAARRVPSAVSAVTVYADRAMVTRVAHLAADVGEGTVVVAGLPAALDEYSLRVGGAGPARVRVTGMKIARDFFGEPTAADLLQAQQASEKAEDERRVLADQRDVWARRVAALQQMAEAAAPDLAKTLARRRVDLVEAEGTVGFLFDNMTKAHAQLAKLDRALRVKDRELEKVRFACDKRQRPRPREEKTVAVGYECMVGGELDLTLTYAMPDAGWEPTYDLRYDAADGSTEVRYLAAVYQRTGEDWDRVQLRLSTARPAAGAGPPALEARYVDFRREVLYAAAPARAVASKQAAADHAVQEEAEAYAPAPLEVATAAVEATGPTVTYAVAGLPSVPADGEPHVVNVAAYRFRGEAAYVVVPEYGEAAYLRVSATNDSDLFFLAGVTNVFRGDEYVGRATLERVVPGAAFEYYLGVDDRLKVKHEVQPLTDDAAGLTGGVRRLSFKMQTTVENLTGAPARAVIKQRLPVAVNKDIKVRAGDAKPKPDAKGADGVWEWAWDLKDKEKRQLTFAYDVEFPRGREVTGL